MAELPRISVVTSCFNAQEHLSSTLQSILSQGYPNLEYIVIDGGSSDDTMAVATQYADRLAVLLSERDEGQYHGIQKGLSMATGEVMAWLNADDVYLPWTLPLVGKIFAKFPEVDWIIGTPAYADADGACIRVSSVAGSAYPRKFIRNGWFRAGLAGYLQQESMFWRRGLWDRVGGLDLSLKLAADFDLWRRFAAHAGLVSVAVPLALFRQRPGAQRSVVHRDKYEAEVARVSELLPPPSRLWRTMASKSEELGHLCRLLIWHSSSVISYCGRREDWVMHSSLRPVARTSLADLMLAHATRLK